MRDGNRNPWPREGQGGNPGNRGPRNGQFPRGNWGGQPENNGASNGETL